MRKWLLGCLFLCPSVFGYVGVVEITGKDVENRFSQMGKNLLTFNGAMAKGFEGGVFPSPVKLDSFPLKGLNAFSAIVLNSEIHHSLKKAGFEMSAVQGDLIFDKDRPAYLDCGVKYKKLHTEITVGFSGLEQVSVARDLGRDGKYRFQAEKEIKQLSLDWDLWQSMSGLIDASETKKRITANEFNVSVFQCYLPLVKSNRTGRYETGIADYARIVVDFKQDGARAGMGVYIFSLSEDRREVKLVLEQSALKDNQPDWQGIQKLTDGFIAGKKTAHSK